MAENKEVETEKPEKAQPTRSVSDTKAIIPTLQNKKLGGGVEREKDGHLHYRV